MLLKDKVLIVTGSTTGIGESIARLAVAEGARVLIHGRNEERGQQLVKELGQHTAFCNADLANPDAPEILVNSSIEHFGQINCIVNNAAWIVRSNLETTDIDLFDRTIAINLRAPLLLIRQAMPWLKKTHGTVINIGSVNGYAGESKQLAYSISKGGLETMTKNLADAHSEDAVRFFHFVVGWVLTQNEYELKVSEGRPENWHESPPPDMVPTGKMTRPDDVARMVVFCLSDQSQPFSGGVFELEQYPWLGRHPKMAGERQIGEIEV